MKMESAMKKLLFAAAVATVFVAVSPAFARMDDGDCMGCGNERYGIPVTPIVQCHFVRQRIETRHGHAIYRKHKVCN
jgi:hypothetical protein